MDQHMNSRLHLNTMLFLISSITEEIYKKEVLKT